MPEINNSTDDSMESRRAALESGRLSRRRALEKFGIRAGAVAFATMGIDEIARRVMKSLTDQKQADAFAASLGGELHSAGVAFADTVVTCEHCHAQMCADEKACKQSFYDCGHCSDPPASPGLCENSALACSNTTLTNFTACAAAHCPPGDQALRNCPKVMLKACRQVIEL